MNVLVGITGSISAYKACDIIRGLQNSGHTVKCVVTPDALEFVTAVTLEALLQDRVHEKMFARIQGNASQHVSLAEWADLFLIAPASASTLAKCAHGIADNLLTATFISCGEDVRIMCAPAMHTNMWLHAATQKNIATLKGYGVVMIGPSEGRLANGDVGVGHIAPVEDIISAVCEL